MQLILCVVYFHMAPVTAQLVIRIMVALAVAWPGYRLRDDLGDQQVPTLALGSVQIDHDGDLTDFPDDLKAVDEASATFSFVQVFKEEHASHFRDLPSRLPSKPYLVWSHSLSCPSSTSCPETEKLAKSRDDFVFVNFDLRDPWLAEDSHNPLPGVTMAPPPHVGGLLPRRPSEAPKYLLTFRGGMHSGWYHTASVRPDLQRLWSHSQPKDTVVEFVDHGYTAEDTTRYKDLLNTVYAIVPHGDGRWNYRFTEVVNACAIPVVIADGVTLPYAQLIDWSSAAVILPESSIKNLTDPQDFMALLPKDAETIRAMRQEVFDINQKYFETPSKRWRAMLKSAEVYVAQRTVS
eukprot:TRINITY_DN4153_c0_g1_i1.p1 TRINITY_DN4153_c0_g1~~TRINITY_DN4153_c0_g1_i1.p1  ORF type:complete len:349 (+),score=39.71 TRINITY_DN4153_c0_g1_i1:37-1083(+)